MKRTSAGLVAPIALGLLVSSCDGHPSEPNQFHSPRELAFVYDSMIGLLASNTVSIIALADSARITQRLSVTPGRVDDLAFSPDGDSLAYATLEPDGSSVIRMLAMKTRSARTVLSSSSERYYRVAWGGDGRRLAVAVGTPATVALTGTVALINVDGSGRRLIGGQGVYHYLEWSPDGRWIGFQWPLSSPGIQRQQLFSPDHGDAFIVQLPSELVNPPNCAYGPQCALADITWTADGNLSFGVHITSGLASTTVYSLKLDGSAYTVELQSSRRILAHAWSTDGSTLAAVEASVLIGGGTTVPELMFYEKKGVPGRLIAKGIDLRALSWRPGRL